MIGLARTAIINYVLNNGETDGVNKVVYLDGLNGVIDIDGCTDILSAVVGIDEYLSFLVSNEDDSMQMFVTIFDLNADAVRKILEQMMLNGTDFAV